MIKFKALLQESYVGSCVQVGSGRGGVCKIFPDATTMSQVVNPDGDNFIQVTPEEFHKYIPTQDIPSKAMKGRVEYYRVERDGSETVLSANEAGLWWVYNVDQDIHYFFIRTLNESPIDSYNTIGDFSKGSSFTSKVDRALVTHPTTIQKVKDFFKVPHTHFDFYFVNTKEGRKYTEVGEVKEDFLWDDLKIKPEQLKNGKIDKSNVTIFFTNNKGDERMPLTPWVMAHRFGHVMARSYSWRDELSPWVERMLKGILEDYGITSNASNYDYSYGDSHVYKARQKYEIAKRHLCETLGTFKSARDKNLRNSNEFKFELFAQFIKDGFIKLNPLPPRLVVSHLYGRPQYATLKRDDDADFHRGLENDYPYYANSVLSDAEGKIWVM